MTKNIHILREEGLINADLSEELLQMVGFRNVLTHGYSRINYKIVHEALTTKYRDIEKLLRVIEEGL